MSEENLKICSWKSPKAILLLIALLAVAAIVVVALVRDRIVNPQLRQVTVIGQGRITYQPDEALVTLGVQIDRVVKAEEALNQLNTKVNNIIAAVKAVGIPVENIQTQNYSLNPQYDYPSNAVPTVSGYSANEQLVIKVTGYDQAPNKLGQVIAAASKAGANQVNNLSFDASNLNDLKQQARVLAIKDARGKSQALAQAAGVKLKEIAGWYENYLQPISAVDYGAKGGMGGAASQTPLAQTPSGSQEVVIEIGVNYNIK